MSEYKWWEFYKEKLQNKTLDEAIVWLRRALNGKEALPSTHDPVLNIDIASAVSCLEPKDRIVYYQALEFLLNEYKDNPVGSDEYLDGLFYLQYYFLGNLEAFGFKEEENISRCLNVLEEIALSPILLSLKDRQQFCLLGSLVDGNPKRSYEFWDKIDAIDEFDFSQMVLSGMFDVDYKLGIKYLSFGKLTKTDNCEKITVLKVDFAFDDCVEKEHFIFLLCDVIFYCKDYIQVELVNWLKNKNLLNNFDFKEIGFTARAQNMKSCSEENDIQHYYRQYTEKILVEQNEVNYEQFKKGWLEGDKLSTS